MSRFNYTWKFALSPQDVVDILRNKDAEEDDRGLAVSFSKLKLNSQNAYDIAEALKDNENCKALDFCINTIGPDGAKAFAEAALYCRVYTMCLHSNGIGDEGMIAFADALKSENCYLRELYLASNDIGKDGALALAEALKVNTRLVAIYFTRNNVGEEAGKAFVDALQYNKTLITFKLNHDNGIKPGTIARINDLVEKNAERQLKLFTETRATDEKFPWHQAKLMVIGQGQVGKTSTVRSLTGMPFDPEKVKSTIGVQTTPVKLLRNLDNQYNHTWSAEDEKYRGAVGGYLNSLSLQIVASKVSSKDESLLPKASEKLNTNAETFKPLPEPGIHNREEVVRKMTTMLAGAMDNNGISIDIWDYGGQDVFHTLHHLLLTRHGLYLLCFASDDLVKDEAEALRYLTFWLNSAKIHAPEAPVIIVGTKAELLKEDELKNINEVVSKLASRYPQVVMRTTESITSFYPISNVEGTGVDDLRDIINAVTVEQKYVNRPLSLLWMKCLDTLIDLSERESRDWLSLTEVTKLANETGIRSKSEVLEMLKLFHELGKLFHFDATDNLSSIIIMKPQWLVDRVAEVIRDKDMHQYDELQQQRIKDNGLYEDYKRLYEEGITTRELLEDLWGHVQVDFLLDLMRETLLLSDYTFGRHKKGDADLYLVPSLLTTSKNLINDDDFECYCIYDFSKVCLPQGVFDRIVCVLIAYSGRFEDSQKPVLSQGKAMLWLGKGSVICLEEGSQKIHLSINKSDNASSSMRVITHTLKKVNQDVMNSKLVWDLYLSTNDENTILYEKAMKKKLKPWFVTGQQKADSAVIQRADLNVFMDFLS
uniref:non-specific serine/threonine protein kinase n=1 Tax=Aplanochytrium stocchinoi TaxID=215587 RepID=A0A7S3V2N8_9STRA|mmetsp:Transcript_31632/g.38975  ORF Transcript_31632/g.38975 Transcript_31632/m.38975 type:complete len:823 (-) Transcript_31632:44-2512(-)|eukprot:CAMPEP_0204868898 /NCGR_PEP_ID=MMETSP1348-20121228/28041_1 /ASSEMBLY_ACC=CAM_ASM_000700 /TAXON_ID=215587 /ORGANISM="Aplanochytrium stocchinoi, Strain GSBS06" /LENGTH=822 /DNA_ID=CAMNT_0052022017 /DNA_START=153 /DNA_END=2621 /DNA_ORIENTATION=-